MPIARLLLTHGAGAGISSDFIQQMAQALTALNIEVIPFNFDYMQQVEQTGKKRPPPAVVKLQQELLNKVEQLVGDLPLFIAGKSMGGRVCTMSIELPDVTGCVVYGYPFHPPGRADKLRTEHLMTMRKPLLIVQGERDIFGNQQEVEAMRLPDTIQLSYLADGDHSFKPRKKSGLTQQQHIQTAAQLSARFIQDTLCI